MNKKIIQDAKTRQREPKSKERLAAEELARALRLDPYQAKEVKLDLGVPIWHRKGFKRTVSAIGFIASYVLGLFPATAALSEPVFTLSTLGAGAGIWDGHKKRQAAGDPSLWDLVKKILKAIWTTLTK